MVGHTLAEAGPRSTLAGSGGTDRGAVAPRWTAAAVAAALLGGLVFGAWSLAGNPLAAFPALGWAAAGVVAGALLDVRLRPGGQPASFMVVPAIVVYGWLGAPVLWLVMGAAAIRGLLRRTGPFAVLDAVALEALACGGALVVAALLGFEMPLRTAVFGLSYVVLRAWFRSLASSVGAFPPLERQPEQPHLALSLALAPLAALPLVAGAWAGDGARLLALAALLALLFVVRETTNLATLRAEVAAERDRLARANQLQEDLIHLITHEIKNPLTAVRVYTQLGRKLLGTGRSALDERLGSYLVNVEQAGGTIERLVENLLQISRLEQSGELPAAERVELEPLMREVAAQFEPLAEQKQQMLRVEVDGEGLAAVAPRLLLREALSNLVSNAVKYTPPGGQVRVWTQPGERPGTIVLGVTDSGIGLSEEDQARLFEKFFRASDPRAQEQRGTGLGLALTRAMISRMAGEIQVHSALDAGTTFRLILPAARRL